MAEKKEESLQQLVQGDNLNDFVAAFTGGGKLKQHAEHDAVRKHERQINRFTRNLEKNRFYNAVQYTQGSIDLKAETKEDEAYIHATKIGSAAGTLVMAQAPMKNTVIDFCRMIWQTNVSTIVTLCDMTDKEQCFPYFERKAGKKNTLKNRFRIRTLAVRTEGKSIIAYELKFENLLEKKDEKASRVINVISVLGWAPEAPFNAKTLVSVIHNVDALRNMEQKKDSALLIHGTSGIRRTGCFALAYMFSKQILVKREINLLGIITAVRELRYGVLRQKQMFHMLLETIVYLISETGVLKPGSDDQRQVLEVIRKTSKDLRNKKKTGKKKSEKNSKGGFSNEDSVTSTKSTLSLKSEKSSNEKPGKSKSKEKVKSKEKMNKSKEKRGKNKDKAKLEEKEEDEDDD